MVIGAGMGVLPLTIGGLAYNLRPWLFAIGAAGFASMQMLQRYDGSSITILRLRRIMLLSDVLFLLSAVLMFASQGNSFGIPQITYVQYIYNKWVGTLLLAAILQLFATHRIASELSKEAKKR
jgi:hypothetical protein